MLQEIKHDQMTVSFDVLLRIADVSRILSISRSMAYRLIQTGEIPSIHIGTAVRVRPRDLFAYIESNESSGSVGH